ncbi:MAG: response regulator [Alphaproteobacteria bacterium]|nr:response regulator [Alphaproteobacteria bacterium]
MLINVVEHNVEADLLAFIGNVNAEQTLSWGLARIKREHLRSFSVDEFILTVKPALQDASKARVFFSDADVIYVVWHGLPRQVYKDLVDTVGKSLLKPASTLAPEQTMTYYDPLVSANELTILLKNDMAKLGMSPPQHSSPDADRHGTSATDGAAAPNSGQLEITSTQVEHYKETRAGKSSRSRLRVLVVEDHPFLRKLLHDALLNDCAVETKGTGGGGWASFLETAPDISFLDIGLPDVDGHTLARRIKELDPEAYVVMLTANNQREDVEHAKRNHVDGYIAKPFNRKIINERIEHYRATHIRNR